MFVTTAMVGGEKEGGGNKKHPSEPFLNDIQAIWGRGFFNVALEESIF